MTCWFQVLQGLDAVLDVGGVYDPSRDRFDHHQQGFTDVFGHGFSTKLSSAGLVYKARPLVTPCAAAFCVLCAVFCLLCAVCCVLCSVCRVLCALCCVLCAMWGPPRFLLPRLPSPALPAR